MIIDNISIHVCAGSLLSAKVVGCCCFHLARELPTSLPKPHPPSCSIQEEVISEHMKVVSTCRTALRLPACKPTSHQVQLSCALAGAASSTQQMFKIHVLVCVTRCRQCRSCSVALLPAGPVLLLLLLWRHTGWAASMRVISRIRDSRLPHQTLSNRCALQHRVRKKSI
jgi:hypothetical protein